MASTLVRNGGGIAVTHFNNASPTDGVILTPYESSRLTHAGYNEDTMLCWLAFPGTKNKPEGSVYEYAGVEPDVWEGFLEAESKGVYITNIIGKRGEKPPYPYVEVTARDHVAENMKWINDKDPELVKRVFAPDERLSGLKFKEGLLPAKSGEIVPASHTIPELPEKDEELKPRALAIYEGAKALIIHNAEEYTEADNRLVVLKADRKLVEARVLRIYDPAYKTYIEARTFRDEALAPYDKAEVAIKDELKRYSRVAADRKRADEHAETKRLQEIENERARQQSKQEAEQEALYVEAQGETEEAQRIRENPVPIAPVQIAPVVLTTEVPKGNSSIKEKWTWRWSNPVEQAMRLPQTFIPQIAFALSENGILCTPEKVASLALSLGPIFLELYSPDEVKIKQRATRLKLSAGMVGVEVFDEGSVSTRAKK